MNSKFQLLRAPQLVISNILHLSSVDELINLALCSKRAFNIVKTCRKKSKDMFIYILNDEVWIFKKPGDTLLSFSRRRIYGLTKLKQENKKYEITKLRDLPYHEFSQLVYPIGKAYWEMRRDERIEDEVLIILEWIIDLFQTKVRAMTSDEHGIRRVEWLNKRQEEMIEMFWSGSYTDDQVRYLINCKSYRVVLNFKARDSFKYDEQLPSRKYFEVTIGSWITIYHLMTIDVISFIVYNSHITNLELNQFMKHRLAGGSVRLKYLVIGMNEINMDVISNGIEEHFHFEDRIAYLRLCKPECNELIGIHCFVKENVLHFIFANSVL